MDENKKISTQEIIETLNIQNANKNKSLQGNVEFSKKAEEILDKCNQKSKKKKLIIGISLTVVLLVLLILALLIPSCAQINKI